jgi:hypothetical protein
MHLFLKSGRARVFERAEIVPRPSVKTVFTHACDVIRRKIISEAIAFVSRAPEFAGCGIYGHPDAIANAARIRASASKAVGLGVGTVQKLKNEMVEACATSAGGSQGPLEVRKYEADEGGPLGVGVQAQTSNRLKLLLPKGDGGER